MTCVGCVSHKISVPRKLGKIRYFFASFMPSLVNFIKFLAIMTAAIHFTKDAACNWSTSKISLKIAHKLI